MSDPNPQTVKISSETDIWAEHARRWLDLARRCVEDVTRADCLAHAEFCLDMLPTGLAKQIRTEYAQ